MRRFLQQTTDITPPASQKEFCMEETAKMNIRESILGAALGFGMVLTLTEQGSQGAEASPKDPMDAYLSVLRQEEGVRNKMYRDTKGIETIAVGFNLRRPDTEKVFQQCFGPDCGDVLARARDRKRGMTDAEVDKLTRYDLETTFLPRVKKLIPDFDKMPEETRAGLLSATYRGSLPMSKKTVALINQGKAGEAANEYLRNREYEVAKKKGSGIAGRMEREAASIRSLQGYKPGEQATPQQTTQASTPAPTPKPASTPTQQPQQQSQAQQQAAREYTVRSGDNLSRIARETGQSVEAIAAANKLQNPNMIRAGQRLSIPGG